jgi:hypothetical protein
MYHGQPSVEYGGEMYFVTCCHSGTILGYFVDSTGLILNPDGTSINGNGSHPHSCFNGTEFYVVWQDYRNGEDPDIYGSRVDTAGAVLDPDGIPICTEPGNQEYPQVKFTGSNYVVIWQDDRNGSDYDILGAVLSPEGTVEDTLIISAQAGDQLSPALAVGPNGQVLSVYSGWTDSINGNPVDTMRIWGKFYPSAAICGDADWDGIISPADGYCTLNYIGAGPQPVTCAAANVNGDDAITPADGFYFLNYLSDPISWPLNCAPCEFD